MIPIENIKKIILSCIDIHKPKDAKELQRICKAFNIDNGRFKEALSQVRQEGKFMVDPAGYLVTVVAPPVVAPPKIEVVKQSETITKIHPILDFKNDKVYTTVWLPKVEENEIKEIPYLITNLKEKIPIDSLSKNLKLRFFPYRVESIENRWSPDSIIDFLNNGSNVKPKEVFDEIKVLLKKHISLDEGYYDFIALWIIGTYFHPLFESYPYLFIIGTKRSGKTKLLQLISLLAFNGILTGSITEASTFRPTQYFRNTLCIDEIERISGKEMANYRDLLKMGYKKGLIIRRQGDKKRDITYEFNVYCPKVLANIQGFEEILEDRGFPIVIERCVDPKIINTFISIEDFEIKKVRDDLYLLLMSDIGYQMSNVTNDNMSQKNDISDISDGKNNISNLIKGRWLELSHPILIIAKLIGKDISEKMIDFIDKILRQKEQIDIVESRDNKFLYCLIDFIQSKNSQTFFEISDLRNHFLSIEGDEYWITNHWIGKALRRLNVIIEEGRSAKRRSVRLDFDKIELKAKTYGLDVDKIKSESKENEDIQKTLEDAHDND
jgi:hypothetical protein